MSKYGFVYLLGNIYMPGIYKVGCTERSPQQRAEELSSGTGVPAPFDVLCYIEAQDFQAVESKFHRWLSHARINPQREFFRTGNLPYLVGMFKFHPDQLSFCRANALASYLEEYEEREIPDPWERPAEAQQEAGIQPTEAVTDGADTHDQA